MVVAGRAGVLTGQSRAVDTVAIFASDALINTRLVAKVRRFCAKERV